MAVLHHRVLRHNTHHCCRRLPTFTAFTFLLFSSASAAITLSPQPSGAGAVKEYQYYQREEKENGSKPAVTAADQKRSGGPGSLPPSCRSKCGWCTPCEPVHVPIQPGLSVPLEYYPEAWRCKCGNKLFMP